MVADDWDGEKDGGRCFSNSSESVRSKYIYQLSFSNFLFVILGEIDRAWRRCAWWDEVSTTARLARGFGVRRLVAAFKSADKSADSQMTDDKFEMIDDRFPA